MSAKNMIPAWLLQQYADKSAATEAVLAASQHQQWARFLQTGLPTKKDERWKYADLQFLATPYAAYSATLSPQQIIRVNQAIVAYRERYPQMILIVVVNGEFRPEFSDAPSELVEFSTLTDMQMLTSNKVSDAAYHENAFSLLNNAMCEHGLRLKIRDNAELTVPIHILSLNIFSQPTIIHPGFYFEFGINSRANIIEQHSALNDTPYVINQVLQLKLLSSAQISLTKIQCENKASVHLAYTAMQQAQDSLATLLQFSLGAKFVRDEICAYLRESGANCHSGGLYRLSHDGQFCDHHIDIYHAAPHSHSEMLYKGIVDKQSRAVFNGHLYVAPQSQKILAYQANHNLLLSNQAEVNSKPELEIYADDVQCKHGATTGQLDEQALFYLRARGIPYAEARQILLSGFMDEIIQRVPCQAVKNYLKTLVE